MTYIFMLFVWLIFISFNIISYYAFFKVAQYDNYVSTNTCANILSTVQIEGMSSYFFNLPLKSYVPVSTQMFCVAGCGEDGEGVKTGAAD